MRPFVVALTGDFLGTDGRPAYGDACTRMLDRQEGIEWRFLEDLAPRQGDQDYWSRLYSLRIEPRHLKGVHGLVVLRPWLQASAFSEGAGELLVVGRSGAGYDKIDVAACTAHGVAVFNAPLALDHSTASSALMFMLALAKRLPQQDHVTRLGRWDLQPEVLGHEIEGRTLGIVGLGHSGRELVRLVAPFRMRVLAHSPRAERDVAETLGVRLTSLDEMLVESDFVSLHCSLTSERRGLIGKAQLARMRPTSYFINVARGELVDQRSLVSALRERRIAGAALDVFEIEPVPAGDPIFELENVILAPHWSASSADVWAATAEVMARGMGRAARGEVPECVVNPEVLDSTVFREKLAQFAVNRATGHCGMKATGGECK